MQLPKKILEATDFDKSSLFDINCNRQNRYLYLLEHSNKSQNFFLTNFKEIQTVQFSNRIFMRQLLRF